MDIRSVRLYIRTCAILNCQLESLVWGISTGYESLSWDVSDERDTLAMGSTRLLVMEEDDSVLSRGLGVLLSWLEGVCFCSN